MKDALGDRMKSYFEDRTRQYLPRKSNVIIRIDGKAFHTYTKGLNKPFDTGLIDDMNETTKYLCANIQGAKIGYVQSDEISILLTDYDTRTTDAWFDYNVQKMTSVAASMATSRFNQLRTQRALTESWNSYVYGRGQEDEPFFLKWDLTVSLDKVKLAQFDARVFTLPTDEVVNYFIWRQQDATKNSISAVAQNLYSHKELNDKDSNAKQEMIFRKGFNWNDFPIGQKRGRTVIRKQIIVPSTKEIYDKAREKDKENWVWDCDTGYGIKRSQWQIDEPPIFTENKDYVNNVLPRKKEA